MGHQSILKGADVALTFRNHPLSVLAPERTPRLIMSPEERVAAIRACGVKDVTVLEFTRELAELAPEAFAARYLTSPVSSLPSAVRCGENWRFGMGGAGDAALLRARGVEVAVVPYAEYRGERISSSRIRRCLERGEVEDANAMMGRRFAVRGSSFRGKGLGEKIGYPTVNVELKALKLALPRGVYEVESGGMKGVANFGLAPTMGEKAWKEPVMEIHFPGARDEDVRRETGDVLSVSFLRFLRPERKFATIGDLKRQIAADCAKIRA